MSRARNIISGVVVAGLAVSAAVALRDDDKPKCVIPACDASEKPVDCQKWVTGPGPAPGRFEWVGCNVFQAKESKGKECLPVECVAQEGKLPRVLK